MTVKQARNLAQCWIAEQAPTLVGFCGAYTAGSTNWLPDATELAETSDLDIMVVLTELPPIGGERRKFFYQSALLEVSYLTRDQLQSPEQVLGDYHLAASLATAHVLLDPFGHLASLRELVQPHYADHEWIRARCANARDKILDHIRSARGNTFFTDRVLAYLFAAGITTHIPLVAGLRNPTVRSRYLAVRELLSDYREAAFHDVLLKLLGAAHISQARAKYHVGRLAKIFDAAQKAVRTPFPFVTDISACGRPIAIEDSLQLIQRGDHREAMFWIAVTHCRCHKILFSDAPHKLTARLMSGYKELLDDFGLSTDQLIKERCGEIERVLPQLWEMAGIISAGI